MEINKKESKIYRNFQFYRLPFSSLEFVEPVFDEVVFVGIAFATSIISSHLITESPILLP